MGPLFLHICIKPLCCLLHPYLVRETSLTLNMITVVTALLVLPRDRVGAAVRQEGFGFRLIAGARLQCSDVQAEKESQGFLGSHAEVQWRII